MMSRLIPVMAAETLVSVPLLKTTVPKPVLEGSIAEVAKMLGYENVKNSQKEAITAFLQGKDVFVSLPTGSGKSLCFALIPGTVDSLKSFLGMPLDRRSVMVIIFPLVSLMTNQVDRYTAKGLSCVMLQSDEEVEVIIQGNHQLIFTSPESLSRCRDILRYFASNLVGLAVDESHCIEEW